MYRIDDPSASPTLPVPEAALTEGFWTEGNPATGVPATLERASWFNMVQEELRAIAVAGGLTPSKTTYNQVLTAIQTVLQKSPSSYAVATGTANAHTIALTPALTARTDGMLLRYKAPAANTSAVTLTDGVGTAAVIGSGHAPLQGGEYIANGDALVVWNSTINSGTYILLECTGGAQQVAPAVAANQAVQLQQVTGLVGNARNLKASLATAGTTLTITADEVAVKSALGGESFLLANFNQTVSTTTTGIGGVVGTALAANGFAAIYAAYNPSTTTEGAYIVNANALVPNVGAAPPSGWICTGLISVWPLDASTQFKVGFQRGRKVSFPLATMLTTSAVAAAPTAFLASAFLPPNAVTIGGELIASSTAGLSSTLGFIGGDVSLSGQKAIYSGAVAGVSLLANYEIDILTAQTFYYKATNSSGTPTFSFFVSNYQI